MTTFQTVLVGISSSLIATFIFLYLNWYVKSIFIPWYEDKIYRGVRVSGHWIVEEWDGLKMDQNDAPVRATIEVKQKADKITGIYTHYVVGDDDPASYNFEGEIRNSYLTATSWPVSNDQIDAGAYVLRVFSHDGLRMKGMVSFIDNVTGDVQGISVEFKKKDS